MSSEVVDGNEPTGGFGRSSILTTASATPVEVTWAATLSPFLIGEFILVSSVTLSLVSKPVGVLIQYASSTLMTSPVTF